MARRLDFLPAREAAALLGVKLATLYAYASRGVVESVPGPRGRGRRYARESLDRLKARHDARAGHAAVAAGALRFGEPSLETSVSEIREDGPYYRGRSALELCQHGARYEAVFDLLVMDAPYDPTSWATAAKELRQLDALVPSPLPAGASTRGRHRPGGQPAARLAAWIALAALTDPSRHAPSERHERMRARRLTLWLAGHAGGCRPQRPGASIAERVLLGLGVRPTARRVPIIDRTLILCADHELNASTFAARVTASTGADLYACLGAACHALSGPRHGGASARVEALLRELPTPSDAAHVLRERFERGEHVPGFGQPLYPHGDPRGVALLQLAAQANADSRRAHLDYARLRAVCDAMQRSGRPGPNLDAGLVAVCAALGLPRGSAAAVFAIGRIGGWVAHALEQRLQPHILRPRARYVAPHGASAE